MGSPSEFDGERAAGNVDAPCRRGSERQRRLGVGLLSRLISADQVGAAAVQSVLFQLVAISANLCTGVITARLLGASGRGLYAAAITWPSLLGMVATAGVGSAVLVYLRRQPRAAAALAGWGASVALGLSTLLAAAAYITLPVLLGPHQQEALPTARAALVFVYVTALGVLFRSVFAGSGRFLLSNLAGVLPHFLHAVAVGAFALAGALTVQTAVASPILGAALSLVLLSPFLLKTIRGRLVPLAQFRADLWAFACRAAPGDLLSLSSGWADRLLLILLLPARELGLYVVAYGLSRVVTLATPAGGILLSAMSDAAPAYARRLHDMALRFYIATLSLALFAVYLLGERVIHLFYGAEFLAGALCFKILVLQAAGLRIAGVTTQFYLASNRPAFTSWVSLADVAVSATLMVVLAPAYGPQGAAVAMLAGTGLRLVLLWLGLLLHLRTPLPRLLPTHEDVRAIRALFRS
jgi:O-antigen/teichoic acid export membrane protein